MKKYEWFISGAINDVPLLLLLLLLLLFDYYNRAARRSSRSNFDLYSSSSIMIWQVTELDELAKNHYSTKIVAKL
jgi:hypothetical protein